MMGEHVPPASEPHEPEPRWRAQRPGGHPSLVDLERIRDALQKRLDQIEALARERPASPAPQGATSDQETSLHQRIAELEQANDQLRVLADRHEQEWRAAFEKLEEDRKLLAEAWERLERERIEAHVEAPVARGARPAPAERPAAHQVRSEVSGTLDDSVAQAVLQQFQVLRGDVRRNANRRNVH